MSIPTSAPVFAQLMDPSDTLDFYVNVSQGNDARSILMVNEDIASYSLALSPEAVAAGLRLLTDERRPIREGRTISFWLTVSPEARSMPIFDGSGVLLGLELTVVTASKPSRTKQRTFGIRLVNQ